MSDLDATNDAVTGKADEPNTTAESVTEPASVPVIRRRPIPRARTLVRILILFLLLALVASWQWTRGRTEGPAAMGFDPGATVVLTVLPGENYGEAAVYLGTQADGLPLADDAAIVAAVRTAVVDEGKTEVLIQAAGAVISGEVARVQSTASAALPVPSGVRVHLSLIPAD
jgi:hypothetical protein